MRLVNGILITVFVIAWIVVLCYGGLVVLAILPFIQSRALFGPDALTILHQALWPSPLKEYITSPELAMIVKISLIALTIVCFLVAITIGATRRAPPQVREPGRGPMLLSDVRQDPHTKDPLGYRRLATSIADTISRSADRSPFAIAIEGRWGIGKTMLMELIRAELKDKSFTLPGANGESVQWKSYTIWFNPWRHRKANAQKAFMNAVFSGIPWRRISWYMGPVMRGRLLAEAGEILTFLRGSNKASASLSNKLDVGATYRDQFQADFERYVQYWRKAEGNAQVVLVIFVDDLDRCAPSDIAAVLEAMKLFFDVKSCVFVLGFEPQMVAASIRKEYGELVPDGLEYLQKLVQVEYPLLQPSDDQIRDMLTEYQLDANLVDVFRDIEGKEPEYRDQIFLFTKRTPRLIKRLVNGMAILTPLHKEKDYVTILDLLLIQARQLSLYRKILEETQTGKIAEFLETLKAQLDEDENGAADPSP